MSSAIPDEEWAGAVAAAKLKERSELKLKDWTKFGYGSTRCDEFERLVETITEDPFPRIDCKKLTPEDFFENFEKKGLPVIIKGIPEAQGWPAATEWTHEKLFARFSNVPFKVGKDDYGNSIRLKLGYFERYMATTRDDSPLYVFDSSFGSRAATKSLVEEYKVPPYFPSDYFSLVGEDERPPYRWILIGPKRSGTTVHTDPLNTSAWNTLLQGRKMWALLPPDVPRRMAKCKDVMQKDDDDEASNFFMDLLPRMEAEHGMKALRLVQYPGETIFVPGGWWHVVVNLDDTVAVTQNYCGPLNFRKVWSVTRRERPCMSRRWLRLLEQHAPEMAKIAHTMNTEDKFDMDYYFQLNRQRLIRKRQRRRERSIRKARKRAKQEGVEFDEAKWTPDYSDTSTDSESTVSSSSSSSLTSSTSSSYSSSTSSSLSPQHATPSKSPGLTT